MNIRITTYSLIVAASCGIAFNQAASAGEEDVRNVPSMRFDFGPNTYALDRVQSRHHSVGTFTPSSVKSGVAPKNLLGLDPSFVKPVPPPPAPTPIAQPTVAAKPIFPAMFNSLFGKPTNTPLVASAPGALPVTAPAQAARPAGHLPQHHVTTSGTAKILHAAKPTALAAAPASYSNLDKFYKQGSVVPGYGGSSSGNGVVSTSLNGSIIPKHR
ncbi:MAG TPA: hypothetical protein V6C97_34720 [Oculatellaceae cyanobacterium]